MFDEDEISSLDDLLPQNPATRRVARTIARPGAVRPPGIFGLPVRLAPTMGYAFSTRRLPDPRAQGSIVCVRTGRREVSAMGREGFFTAWEDGKFLEVPPDFVVRVANGKFDPALTRRVANLDSVVGKEFSLSATSPQELIHKATRDLWAFQDVGGQYQLCRLFDHDGTPLRV